MMLTLTNGGNKYLQVLNILIHMVTVRKHPNTYEENTQTYGVTHIIEKTISLK